MARKFQATIVLVEVLGHAGLNGIYVNIFIGFGSVCLCKKHVKYTCYWRYSTLNEFGNKKCLSVVCVTKQASVPNEVELLGICKKITV